MEYGFFLAHLLFSFRSYQKTFRGPYVHAGVHRGLPDIFRASRESLDLRVNHKISSKGTMDMGSNTCMKLIIPGGR
jgi:hypothetical protein